MHDRGISYCMHYLDDFLTVGPAESDVCERNLEVLKSTCKDLGVPLKLEKVEGPATTLVFLGIQLDTVAGVMSLPQRKLEQYKTELWEWRHKRACKKRELLSLIGKLAHACKVVRPGRIFLRRMIETSCAVDRPDFWVRLDEGFRSDLWWWISFLELWNGKGRLSHPGEGYSHQVVMSTDASGNWGSGAVWDNHWIQCAWEGDWLGVCIAAKELLPIVIACAVWGRQWRNGVVLNRFDNMSVVLLWESKKSRHPLIMHLLRCIHFICAYFEFELHIWHIRGVENVCADAVSRNLLQVLNREAPGMDQSPVQVPPALWQLLVIVRPDWLSPRWNQLWLTFLRTV